MCLYGVCVCADSNIVNTSVCKHVILYFSRNLLISTLPPCIHTFTGGPLHLGDIEDIGCGESPRVRCPWHKWCFELTTGKQVRPHLGGKSTTTYPARLRENGQIEIGFQSLDKNYFTSGEF